MIAFSIHRRLITALFVVALSMSGSVPADSWRLNPLLVSGGRVWNFKISPDGNWVVYQSDQETNHVLDLYSVPIVGPASSSIRLSRGLGLSGDVIDFRISPESRRVAFRFQGFRASVGDNPHNLYSGPIDGPEGSSVRLNPTLVENGDVTQQFEFTPDSRRVVYIADQDTDEVFELYVSNATTAARTWEGYEYGAKEG